MAGKGVGVTPWNAAPKPAAPAAPPEKGDPLPPLAVTLEGNRWTINIWLPHTSTDMLTAEQWAQRGSDCLIDFVLAQSQKQFKSAVQRKPTPNHSVRFAHSDGRQFFVESRDKLAWLIRTCVDGPARKVGISVAIRG